MSETTNIEWCDSTFNPWIGCTRVSPACDDCYAARSTPARTLGVVWGAGEARRRTSEANWKLPIQWERDHAAFFAEHGRRRRVFCASLADVFDNEVPAGWRVDLFNLIAATPNLDWLLLTKRIGNVGNMLPVPFDFDRLYPNVWLGATVVNQAEADRDIPKLLAVPARVRFLSIEPMLSDIDITPFLWGKHEGVDTICQNCPRDADCECGYFTRTAMKLASIDWVIVGGESGPKARPMSPDWARAMRDQCTSAGVPLLFKQWGEWLPMLGQVEGAPVRDKTTTPDGWVMGWAGKKAAGRLLDGIEHNGYPGAA